VVWAIGDAIAPDLSTLSPGDTLDPTSLAGAPGWAFGKVPVDVDGRLGVPFWRAIDLASDNRIPAGETVTTSHVFDASGSSGAVTVTVVLVYRKFPWSVARARGWPSADEVRLVRTITVP
jgi:hypothetical protein